MKNLKFTLLRKILFLKSICGLLNGMRGLLKAMRGLLLFCLSVLFSVSLISLSGCSGCSINDLNIFRDRSYDYTKATCIPVLEMPPGIHRENFNDAYQIP